MSYLNEHLERALVLCSQPRMGPLNVLAIELTNGYLEDGGVAGIMALQLLLNVSVQMNASWSPVVQAAVCGSFAWPGPAVGEMCLELAKAVIDFQMHLVPVIIQRHVALQLNQP